MKKRSVLAFTLLAGALAACHTTNRSPQVQAVSGFDPDRYLGKWYELGRVENRFERGMTHTTAHYSMNTDGTIKVVNAGYDPQKGSFRSATGKAKFAGDSEVGALKVSFFGPFYGGYNVVALDRKYQWSIVAGDKPEKYFWVLSRQPTLTKEIKAKAISVARQLGVDPDSILWVEQKR
ncbi:lipocalin [Falsochrobactrum shanghaiense]|uniref:Outer membrane lipoprotein Blc n=1 Tax=Falsochrobactrum shanghaiense TaxID=2201899 RepID=A0A316JUJ7_9HYPH|nr:lipocalin family protein [Falsochrobactrum shanghaiense]PWL18840.1 lipocalin [Falsochrobactrum shanghaiense]